MSERTIQKRFDGLFLKIGRAENSAIEIRQAVHKEHLYDHDRRGEVSRALKLAEEHLGYAWRAMYDAGLVE